MKRSRPGYLNLSAIELYDPREWARVKDCEGLREAQSYFRFVLEARNLKSEQPYDWRRYKRNLELVDRQLKWRCPKGSPRLVKLAPPVKVAPRPYWVHCDFDGRYKFEAPCLNLATAVARAKRAGDGSRCRITQEDRGEVRRYESGKRVK